MKAAIFAAAVLFASTAYAVQPTPIAFETIVSLDRFRITNLSPSAHVFEIIIRPSAAVAPVAGHDEMMFGNLPPWPGDDRIGWFVSRFRPGEWMEVAGSWAPDAMLSIQFAEPFTQSRGFIFAPIQNGTFEGWTVPEPGAWVMGLVGVAIVIALYRRARREHGMLPT